MRKLILFGLSVLMATSLFGGHDIFTNLSYRYVGDSTGINDQYELTLNMYWNNNLIPSQSTNINYSSSCYVSRVITLNLQTNPSVAPPQKYRNCLDTPVTYQNPPLKVVYKGLVTLSGPCMDHHFRYQYCCTGSGTNIGSSLIIARCTLDNILGPQSLSWENDHLNYLCRNRSVDGAFCAKGDEHDSIYYTLVGLDQNSFSPGYSAKQPFPSSFGFSFDSINAHYSIEPNLLGIWYGAIEAHQFRFDSIVGSFKRIGTIYSPFVFNTSLACQPDSLLDLEYDPRIVVYGSPTDLPILHVDCLSDTIKIPFKDPVDGFSISENDIRIFSPSGVPVPVFGPAMEPRCPYEYHEVKFWCIPLTQNGDYVLQYWKGSDGNTLKSLCGVEIPEFDTLILRVMNCPITGLNEVQAGRLDFYPNPTKGPFSFFSENLTPPFDLSVYSISGMKLMEAYTEDPNWDLSELPSGIYLLQVRTQNKVYQNRITIQK
mgnify:FL=1